MTINYVDVYDVVLKPEAGTIYAGVLPAYRDASTSEPVTRMKVPRGVGVVYISNDTDYIVSLRMVRGGNEQLVKQVPARSTTTAELITELDSNEMWITLSSAANVNTARTQRVGLKVFPGMSGGGLLKKLLHLVGWSK